MTKPLTARQQLVLDTIRSWTVQRGYPPTIRELGQALGIKSLRGVTAHLDALVKKGRLTRHRGARSLLPTPSASATALGVRVPIIGQIRAGEPILAQEQVEGYLTVDGEWLRPDAYASTGEYFALKVQGKSMAGAGILEGDFVIVHRQSRAENGDVVAVLLGEEATVKRFFQEEGRVRLQPAHPTMAPVLVEAGEPLAILGKVIAVFRRLA